MQAPAPPTGAAPGVRTIGTRRDEEFAAYLEARQTALLRTAYLVTGNQDEAEDVLQTALAKLYLAWDKVHEREALDSYVRRIIVNETTSLWRRAWRRRERSTEVLPETPATDAYDDGDRDALWSVVTSLPPRARAVVVLRYYEQLSEAETAQVLGVSTGTVKSQTSRAMALLRERTPAHLSPRAQEEER